MHDFFCLNKKLVAYLQDIDGQNRRGLSLFCKKNQRISEVVKTVRCQRQAKNMVWVKGGIKVPIQIKSYICTSCTVLFMEGIVMQSIVLNVVLKILN